MEGENVVYLKGFLKYPDTKVTRNGNKKFQAKLAIPKTFVDRNTGEKKTAVRYVKISAWGEVAAGLELIPAESPIEVRGSYQESAYDGHCRSCGSEEKKYWSDVVVDTFSEVALSAS